MFSEAEEHAGTNEVEHLTADGGSSPETPASASMPDPELDRALARAIRALIAEAGERETVS